MMASMPCMSIAVVPILIGPLQVLLAILPGIIVAVLGGLISIFKPRAIKTTALLLWRLKVQVAIFACCLAAVTWAARDYWPSPGPAATALEEGKDWPMFRGSLSRRGCTASATGPTGGGVNWVHKTSGQAFYSSPAAVGNRVYVASASPKAIGADSGRIYCFDADTGAVVWSSAPEGYRPTFSSPVVSGSRLVCGEGLHLTKDARIICLDISPEAKGKVLWTFRTRSHVECSPVIADGRVFIGAGDDGHYCLDLESGEEIWHKDGAQYPDAETSLAVHDGRAYAGLGLGGTALCVLDAATGRELRRIKTPMAVFSPPAVHMDDEGKAWLLLGMGSGDYANSAEVAAEKELAKRRARMQADGASPAEITAALDRARDELAPGGQVWCVDIDQLLARDHAGFRPTWTYSLSRTVLGSVAVVDDEVYFASRDGGVYCVDRANGQLLARAELHEPVKASVAVTDQSVYAMTAGGALFGLSRRSLEPAWEVRLGSARTVGEQEAMCISSPAVARGRVYVGTQQEGFICVGKPGRPRVPLWPGRLGGPGRSGCLDNSPLPKTPALGWQWPVSDDQAGQDDRAPVVAPPAALQGRLFVPVASGPAAGLSCLPLPIAKSNDNGAKPALTWTHAIAAGVWTSPAVVGDKVFAVSGRKGEKGRALHCLDTETGAPLWTSGIAGGASGLLQACEEFLVVQDRPGQLSWFDLSGERKHSARIGPLDHAPAIAAAMVVAAPHDGPSLVALDSPTGKELWRIDLPSPTTTSPALGRSVVFVATARQVAARRLTDGQVIWQTPVSPGGDLVLTRRYVLYVSSDGRLIVADRTDGRIILAVKGAMPATAPLVSRGHVIFETLDSGRKQQRIVAIDLDALGADPAPAPVEWFEDTSWLGRPVTPMVLAGSNVYMGRAGWGLVSLGAER